MSSALASSLTFQRPPRKAATPDARIACEKPRVYCCTGFYELSQTTARTLHSGDFSVELSAKFSAPGAGIWAARYDQLKVEYLQIATQGTAQPPRDIALKPDCTHLRSGIMGEGPVVEETRPVEKPEDIWYAQGAVATLEDTKEIEDESQDNEYWEAFREAEGRIESSYNAELIEEDSKSLVEEMGGHFAAEAQK